MEGETNNRELESTELENEVPATAEPAVFQSPLERLRDTEQWLRHRTLGTIVPVLPEEAALKVQEASEVADETLEQLAAIDLDQVAATTGVPVAKLRSLAEEFTAATPSLAVAGGIGNQHAGSGELAAAVHLLNYVAGNVGATVRFDQPLPKGDGFEALAAEAGRMDRGEIQVVLLHEANPHHTVPTAAGFAAAFAKVPFKVSTAQVLDESAAHPMRKTGCIRHAVVIVTHRVDARAVAVAGLLQAVAQREVLDAVDRLAPRAGRAGRRGRRPGRSLRL